MAPSRQYWQELFTPWENIAHGVVNESPPAGGQTILWYFLSVAFSQFKKCLTIQLKIAIYLQNSKEILIPLQSYGVDITSEFHF